MPRGLQFWVWGAVPSPGSGAGVGTGYGPSLRRSRPREACSRLRAETPRGCSTLPPLNPPTQPGETDGSGGGARNGLFRSARKAARHSPTCRPPACRPLPPPVHFVDTRTQPPGFAQLTAPGFDSVPRVFMLRVDYCYLLVPDERIPAPLRVRQIMRGCQMWYLEIFTLLRSHGK